jgi:hypothetical protein
MITNTQNSIPQKILPAQSHLSSAEISLVNVAKKIKSNLMLSSITEDLLKGAEGVGAKTR